MTRHRIALRRLAARLCLATAAFALAGAADGWSADLLGRVRQDKVLVIGTSNDAPLSYVDQTTKQAAGALPDILREFLHRQGIDAKLQVIAMPFASLIPSIQSDRIGLIGDAMYIRPARQKVIDFTAITFYNPESLDVAKGNPKNLHSLADLCGRSAGTYQGTTYAELLKKTSAVCPAGKPIAIQLYPTIQNAFADLSAGRIDAAVVDASLSAYALKQNPALAFALVADYRPQDKVSSGCAFGVAKGNEAFVSAFNQTYGAMKKDGAAARILAKWGLQPTAFFLNP